MGGSLAKNVQKLMFEVGRRAWDGGFHQGRKALTKPHLRGNQRPDP